MAKKRRATMPFGKHKGCRISSLPDDYLTWLGADVPMLPWLRSLVEAELLRRDFRIDTMAPPLTEKEAAERKQKAELAKGELALAEFNAREKEEAAQVQQKLAIAARVAARQVMPRFFNPNAMPLVAGEKPKPLGFGDTFTVSSQVVWINEQIGDEIDAVVAPPAAAEPAPIVVCGRRKFFE